MNSLTRNKKPSIHQDITCQICGQKSTRALYTYTYNLKISHILQCQHCYHLFIYPVPLGELKERNMNSLSDAELFHSSLLKILYKKFIIDKEVCVVKKFLTTSSKLRLLDIGCGTGWTTSLWREHGFETLGLESSLVRSEVAKNKYGLEVITEHFENFSKATYEHFDIIILRHLLEHIDRPKEFLEKVRAILKSQGILLIVIPNINCMGRFVFRENWEWVLPWHLHFYTPKTLTRLLEDTGYRKLKIYQMPSPLWYPHTLNKALFGSASKIKLPNFAALLLSLPIVLLGVILNLNDNMTLIFQNES